MHCFTHEDELTLRRERKLVCLSIRVDVNLRETSHSKMALKQYRVNKWIPWERDTEKPYY
jgi:hypothetical protein